MFLSVGVGGRAPTGSATRVIFGVSFTNAVRKWQVCFRKNGVGTTFILFDTIASNRGSSDDSYCWGEVKDDDRAISSLWPVGSRVVHEVATNREHAIIWGKSLAVPKPKPGLFSPELLIRKRTSKMSRGESQPEADRCQ